MQSPVKERVQKLREEITDITEANRRYVPNNRKTLAAAEHHRRLQRLEEILKELGSLKEWKET